MKRINRLVLAGAVNLLFLVLPAWAADLNPPIIRTVAPADGTTYTGGDSVQITVTASDADGDSLQYQFLVDGVVKRSWGPAASWTWNTAGIFWEHSITVQVRDPYAHHVERSFKLFGYRRPVPVPTP